MYYEIVFKANEIDFMLAEITQVILFIIGIPMSLPSEGDI